MKHTLPGQTRRMVSSPFQVIMLLIMAGLTNNPSAAEESATGLPGSVAYQRVFPALTFTQPVFMLQQPGDDRRFYVLEKEGRIYYFDNRDDVAGKHLWLDISEQRVDSSFEGGLLGMAFDPGFENNRYVYLSYTSSDDPSKDNSKQLVSRISRFRVNGDNSTVLPESEEILLTLDQPHNNHNGGQISFGPDGYLYIGFGDGGSWGDPDRNAQNTRTLLGTLLRIDVRNGDETDAADGTRYGIPPDNPFAASPGCQDGPGCPEIFAWGLRNPWRWSFDKATGRLWMGDVGQGDREEINLVTNGGNYGWNCYEGKAEYRLELCDRARDYIPPVVDYSHIFHEESRDRMAASVTGGYVYRGEDVPALGGAYLYADYIHGKIWVLPDPYSEQPRPIELFDTDFFIVSFAEDNAGELYFLNYMGDGGIYRFVSGGQSLNR